MKRELLDVNRYRDEQIRKARESLPLAILQFTREIHLQDKLLAGLALPSVLETADPKMRALITSNSRLTNANDILQKKLNKYETKPTPNSPKKTDAAPKGRVKRDYDPTELCTRFASGTCKFNNQTCYWRHGDDDDRYTKTDKGFQLKDPNRDFGPKSRPLKVLSNHMGTADEDDSN